MFVFSISKISKYLLAFFILVLDQKLYIKILRHLVRQDNVTIFEKG